MVTAAPGANSRGRGGKFKKFTRGGGKQFSRNLQPVDTHGNAVSMWSEEAHKQSSDEDDDDEDEESEGEESRGPSSSSAAPAEASREDRKALKKARKEAAVARAAAHKVEVGDLPSDEDSDDDDDEDEDDGKKKNKGNMPANPNHSAAARKQTNVAAPSADAGVDEITEGVRKLPGNRKEREAAEAAAAKERYMRLSAQGKTDTAKADLTRLKLIREQREAEAARRQAEKEEKEEQEAKRRAEIEAREAKRREAAAGPKVGGKKKK